MDVCLLKALADPTRTRIVDLLAGRSYCVRALSRLLDMSESAVSQHLKVLRDAELVEGVKFGYYTHYRLRRETLSALRGQLDALIATQCVDRRQDCAVREEVGCRTHIANKGGAFPC